MAIGPQGPNFRQVLRRIFDSIRNAIRITPSPDMIDPTGRMRTSNPETLFSNKNLHSRNSSIMKEKTVGGGSINYLPNESSVNLTTTAADGDTVLRQSRHVPYVAGKGIRAQDTFELGDDFGDVAFVLRTSTSGTKDDSNIVYQADWNVDKLDGSGDLKTNPSGINLDDSKVQLLYVDALWQGVGNVRTGFKIGDNIIICHEFETANVSDVVYFMRPSLPVRYEIENSGGTTYARIGYFDELDGAFLQATKTTAATNTLKEICCQVDSEGGFQIPGVEFAAPELPYAKAVTGTPLPIIAIRLKTTLPGNKKNRVTARFLSARARVAGFGDAWITLHHIHDPTFTVTGGWTSAGTDSAVEYHTNITSVTSTIDHVIDAGPVSSGLGFGSSSAQVAGNIFNEHGLISMNIDADQSQAFVVFAESIGGTSLNISIAMQWTEFD